MEFSPLGLILRDYVSFEERPNAVLDTIAKSQLVPFSSICSARVTSFSLTGLYPPLQCDRHPYSFLRLHPYSAHPYVVSEGKICLRASLFPVISACKPLTHLHLRVDFPPFSLGQFCDDAGSCGRKWRNKPKDEAKNIQSPCILSVMAPDSCLLSCYISLTTATTAAGTESAGASAAAATADTFTNTTVAAINNPTACAATICYDNLTAILVTTTTAVSAG